MAVYYILSGLLVLVLIVSLYTYKAANKIYEHVDSKEAGEE